MDSEGTQNLQIIQQSLYPIRIAPEFVLSVGASQEKLADWMRKLSVEGSGAFTDILKTVRTEVLSDFKLERNTAFQIPRAL